VQRFGSAKVYKVQVSSVTSVREKVKPYLFHVNSTDLSQISLSLCRLGEWHRFTFYRSMLL